MRGSETLWRALETARRANLRETGAPAPVAGPGGATRRAVIAALGGGAVIGALPAMALPRRPVVAIIGGGIAGLTALWHLTQAGVDAQLYEARNRLGGRMRTRIAPDGTAFEDGGQLVNTDHDDMHALLKAFGIPLVDRKDTPHRSLVLAGGKPVAQDALADALRPIAAQIGRDADRLDRDYARVAAELDRMSIAGYCDRHAALFPQPWVRSLIESTSRTEYGVEPDRASALELIFNLPTVDGQQVEILGRSDERYVISGGSSALVTAMGERLASRITTGKRLAQIARMRSSRLSLAFHDGATATADAVIVAVPAPITRQIGFDIALPSKWRAFIEIMDLGRNEKVQAIAATRAWDAPLGEGGELWEAETSDYALGWDGSVRGAGSGAPAWTWFLGGDQVTAAASGDPGAWSARYAASAEAGVPGMGAALSAGPFRRTAWHRDALTLGGYSNWAPGQLTRFGDLLWVDHADARQRQTARFGDLWFAGEHLSDAYPGYMNGGAQTGRLAAQGIMAAAGIRHAA